MEGSTNWKREKDRMREREREKAGMNASGMVIT